MTGKRCYGVPPVGASLGKLQGALVVIEGPDSSGRSTQIALLSRWLEQMGYAVSQVGLKRSRLVAPELNKAKRGNTLHARTMSLFYATDFYDQLENRIIPALRAGFIVLADRYIFTLMARDRVRGREQAWLDSLYSMALVPDAVYFLIAPIRTLVQRRLASTHSLDYWESGLDMGLSADLFESYLRYQGRLQAEFRRLQRMYGFEMVSTYRSIAAVQKDLRNRVAMKLKEIYGDAGAR
jgi:dTMP kinase